MSEILQCKKPFLEVRKLHHLRDRIKMSDADITRRFERLGYNVTIDQIAFTTESVEDFYNARDSDWTGIGKIRIYEPPGLLVIEGAQPSCRPTNQGHCCN